MSGNSRNWLSAQNQTFPDYIDFDLGMTWALDGAALWNMRGTIATDGVTFFTSPDASFTNLTQVGSGNLQMVSLGTAYVQSDNFAFPVTSTRYVRMRIDSTYDTNDRVGLGEVAFSVVPEPSTGAIACYAFLFALGLGRGRIGESEYRS